MDSREFKLLEPDREEREQCVRGQAMPAVARSDIAIDLPAPRFEIDFREAAIACDHLSILPLNRPGADASLAVFAKAKVQELLRGGARIRRTGDFFPRGNRFQVLRFKGAQRDAFGLQYRHLQNVMLEEGGEKAANACAQRVRNRAAKTKFHAIPWSHC
ncbi:MAG TPA: hypothetical protein VNZ56_01880 [Verrucomicrobiae bacterium]|nr:hypothetical protein [Verrucomicrobiae bacterium]